MRILAPAKVNLCLFVGRPRDDGYHPLVSVFQTIGLADELTLEPAERDEIVCPGVQGPNLAGKALALFREATGWDEPVRISIDKRIPVAAGLGGGSADAAAVLKLAAQASGLDADLQALAPRLGADVPFQLHQGRALVTGIGEHIEALPAEPRRYLILPSVHELSTAAVYAEADRLGTTRDLEGAEARARAGARANDLQPAAISLCPEIEERLALLGEGAMVAGSGPTVFKAYDGEPPDIAGAIRA